MVEGDAGQEVLRENVYRLLLINSRAVSKSSRSSESLWSEAKKGLNWNKMNPFHVPNTEWVSIQFERAGEYICRGIKGVSIPAEKQWDIKCEWDNAVWRLGKRFRWRTHCRGALCRQEDHCTHTWHTHSGCVTTNTTSVCFKKANCDVPNPRRLSTGHEKETESYGMRK